MICYQIKLMWDEDAAKSEGLCLYEMQPSESPSLGLTRGRNSSHIGKQTDGALELDSLQRSSLCEWCIQRSVSQAYC